MYCPDPGQRPQPPIHLDRNAGSVLLLVSGLLLVGAVLSFGVMTYAISNARLAQREVLLERALHVAEAGVEHAAQFIDDQDAYLFTDPQPISGHLNGGFYQGEIRKLGFRTYSITCTGTVGMVSRRIDIEEVFVPTFAQFGWWCEVNGPIWFIPGDVLYGKVHTDDNLRLNTSTSQPGPIFEGDLTSLASSYKLRKNNTYETTETDRYAAETHGAVFNEGFDLGSGNGSMANVKWDKTRALAANPSYTDSLLLEGYTEITIDGSNMRITNPNTGWVDEVVPIHPEQLVYVADRNSSDAGNVMLHGGELDGKVTIFAEDDIFLMDHTTYANDPRDDDLPEHLRAQSGLSDDALGLVSKDDVWIHPTAPNNLDIFAGIMATGSKDPSSEGEFGVYDHDSRPPSGDLTVFGSIVQSRRGAVSTFDGSGLKTGFYKDYYWDKRFKKAAPPHYPALDEDIVLQGWSEHPASAAAYP